MRLLKTCLQHRKQTLEQSPKSFRVLKNEDNGKAKSSKRIEQGIKSRAIDGLACVILVNATNRE
jgi:hypothetical protein